MCVSCAYCCTCSPGEFLHLVDNLSNQARVIEDSTDFKVGIFCGGSTHVKNPHNWEKRIEKYEEFYKPKEMKMPRIFGMTASPVVGKGASNQANLPKSINSLEYILDAKTYTKSSPAYRCYCGALMHTQPWPVYSVEDKLDLKRFVASPVVKVYPYGPVVNGSSSSYMIYVKKLSEIKGECLSTLSRERHDVQSLRNIKKQINRLHDNLMYCLENLGVWGARLVIPFSIKTDFLILII
ncbi:hypothetical protein Patl1_35318 [Pistacia atlantica]|nr:hypothetical protein Patl1_35318 [Pistacia atlantica]